MLIQAIISVVLAVLMADIVKAIVSYYTGEKIIFFRDGGMPSTHSAAVAALCLAVYYEQGFDILLLICIVFSIIVVHDAYNVRWEVTRHSAAINKLTKSKQYITTGHTKAQVAVGILLGAAVAFIVYLF